MVERDQMTVVREQRCILRILTADRQAQDLIEITVVGIDPEDHNRVIAGIGTDQIFEIRRDR